MFSTLFITASGVSTLNFLLTQTVTNCFSVCTRLVLDIPLHTKRFQIKIEVTLPLLPLSEEKIQTSPPFCWKIRNNFLYKQEKKN